MCARVFLHVLVEARRGPQVPWTFITGSETLIWALGTELRSPGKEASALNH